MLYEYAIEPGAVRTLERLQRCIGEFGVPHGRLIVKFPKKWAQMVEESLDDCGDVQKLRMLTCLEQLKRATVSGRGNFDPNAGWVASAIREHERQLRRSPRLTLPYSPKMTQAF